MRYYIRLARYTIEKSVTDNLIGDYGFVIPANLLLYYNKSLSEYLKNRKKPFFIDPMTYLFKFPSNLSKSESGQIEKDSEGKNKIKKSYEKLIQKIDPVLIESFKQGLPISTDYFTNNVNFVNFIQKNIEIQINTLQEQQNKIIKYENMIGENIGSPVSKPEFITSPYFYFDSLNDIYYLNVNLANETKRTCHSDPVYAILCFDKILLSKNTLVDRIINDFRDLDGFILYISDFDFEKESILIIKRLIDFINSLHRETRKPIINLYSRAFSLYLSVFGLSGFSSGLCILEKRDATADSGFGVMNIRFYLPSSHEKITETNLKIYLKDFNTLHECDCEFCTSINQLKKSKPAVEYIKIIDNLFISNRGELNNYCMKHFLINRLNEIENLNSITNQRLLEELKIKSENANKYRVKLDTKNNSAKILAIIG